MTEHLMLTPDMIWRREYREMALTPEQHDRIIGIGSEAWRLELLAAEDAPGPQHHAAFRALAARAGVML